MYKNQNVEYIQDHYTRKNNRNKRKDKRKEKYKVTAPMDLISIKPRTQNQKRTFEEYAKNKNLLLHGVAGTGKTFISLYLALKELYSPNNTKENIIIVRSVVPSRDMGFLPGNQKEKAKAYEAPYYSIFTELFNRGDAYEYLKKRESVNFLSTSFIRGTTFTNSIIVVDECQNMNWQELDTVMTRIGSNSKIIFSGDFRQSDLKINERDDLKKFINILSNMNDFSHIEFAVDDIVRSDIVKDYIVEKLNNGMV